MTDLLRIGPLLRIMCLPSAAGTACFYTFAHLTEVDRGACSSNFFSIYFNTLEWHLKPFSEHTCCYGRAFFPQPCEQGRRVKRIHAVANIGTALKFLEGRKVRSKMKTLKEESLSTLSFTLLSVGLSLHAVCTT